jgi:hypothetical protein
LGYRFKGAGTRCSQILPSKEELAVTQERGFPPENGMNSKEVGSMRRCRPLSVVIFFFSISLIFACSEKKESEMKVTAKEVQKAAQEAAEKAITYTRQQKKEYQDQIEGKIKEYDRKLEELKSRAGKMQKEAKAEANKGIMELQEKQKALSQQLTELKKATGQGWEDLKSGMDKAAEDLAKAFERFTSHFPK